MAEVRLFKFQSVEVTTSYEGSENIFFTPDGKTQWQMIDVDGRPDRISLKIKDTSTYPGKVFFVLSSSVGREQPQVIDAREYELQVPVTWEKGMPFTRRRGKDNIDLIRLSPDGKFTNLQFSLVTHQGEFFLTGQQVYLGQIGVTYGRKVEFVPLSWENAYPDASYEFIWSEVTDFVFEIARSEGAKQQLSRTKAATWNPSPVQKAPGWPHRGWVLYFNACTRTGRVQDADTGKTHFVYWEAVTATMEDKYNLPILQAGEGVVFRLSDRESKPGQLPPVKSIKPAPLALAA